MAMCVAYSHDAPCLYECHVHAAAMAAAKIIHNTHTHTHRTYASNRTTSIRLVERTVARYRKSVYYRQQETESEREREEKEECGVRCVLV